MKVTVLVSGGKDSVFTLGIALHQFSVKSIVTIHPPVENYLFHHPNTWVVKLIAETLDLPLREVVLEDNLDELQVIKENLIKEKAEAIVVGGLLSEFQRMRFNRLALSLNIPCFSPLWRLNQEMLLGELLSHGFEIWIVSVSAMGLGRKFLGQITEETLSQLVKARQRFGVSIGGEGGEYESLVFNAPFYKHRIRPTSTQIHWNDSEETGWLEIKDANLEGKQFGGSTVKH